MEIEDRPRFGWRGVMLDVARNYFLIDYIKRTIDLLAFYKMNRLHLHLTDSQAWRLEIKKYPLLGKPLDRHDFPCTWQGNYSQEDIREIVSYAKERHVIVVPEIEFPGHSDAVLTAYPELLCVTHASHQGGWDHKEFCPGNEKVFQFADDVLAEVTALFDAPYIHIGGDEYMGTAWEKCPDCQRRIESEGLIREDTPELEAMFSKSLGSHKKYLLYRYLMRRIARLVVNRNRIPILWDDLSWQGQYPDKSAVVQWHYRDLFDYANKVTASENPAVQAVRTGHDAIVASASHLYFDYFDGGRLIKRVYEFEPMPVELKGDSVKRIFGSQACLWECPQEKADSMLFPRLLALAETGWTDKSLCKWNDFSVRLDTHIPELKRRGVRYAPVSNREEIFKNGLTDVWNFSPNIGWLKDWMINDVVMKDGIYEARFEFIEGGETTKIEKAFWTRDGAEIPMEAVESKDKRCSVYRFVISGVTDDILYSLRPYFSSDGKVCSQVKVRVSWIG
jgi:hexosaminidase